MRGGLLFCSIRTFLAVIIVVAVLPGSGPSLAASPAPDELVSLARSAGKPVIADFGLVFCMQCKKQAETLERVRKAYDGKVTVRMVNAVKEQQTEIETLKARLERLEHLLATRNGGGQ